VISIQTPGEGLCTLDPAKYNFLDKDVAKYNLATRRKRGEKPERRKNRIGIAAADAYSRIVVAGILLFFPTLLGVLSWIILGFVFVFRAVLLP